MSTREIVFNAGTADPLKMSWDGTTLKMNGITVGGGSGGVLPGTSGGRLSVQSAVPMPVTDQVGKSTLFWTPFTSQFIPIYFGGKWTLINSAEISLALSGMTTDQMYDVFVTSADGATLTFAALLPWTDSTHPVARGVQDGVLVNASDASQLLVGAIGATGATTTEDSRQNRRVSNLYNPRERSLGLSPCSGGAAYGYSLAPFRAAFNDASNRVSVARCLDLDVVELDAHHLTTSSAATLAAVGIGVDSVTVNSATAPAQLSSNPSGGACKVTSRYVGTPGLGLHLLTMLESAGGTGGGITTTWYASGTSVIPFSNGMAGHCFA